MGDKEENTNIDPIQLSEPAKKDGVVVQPYDDTNLLSRLDTLEKDHNHLKKVVDFVQNTNSVVLLVLALGFLSLVITVIGGIIQSWNDGRAVQIELIKSIEKLSVQSSPPQMNYPAPITSTSSATPTSN